MKQFRITRAYLYDFTDPATPLKTEPFLWVYPSAGLIKRDVHPKGAS